MTSLNLDRANNILSQLPGALYIKHVSSERSEYHWANPLTAKLFGVSKPNELIGLTDADMNKASAKFGENFLYDDIHVSSNNPLICLNVFDYKCGDISALIVNKRPYFDATNQICGVICNATPLRTHQLLNTFGDMVLDRNNRLKEHIYRIEKPGWNLELTHRETEVLYYFLHGKSAKQIASAMKLSYRTVEKYIENIKFRIGAKKKSDICEYAHQHNLLRVIPMQLIKKNMCSELLFPS